MVDEISMLYDQNSEFLNGITPYPKHLIEIWRNVYEQTGYQRFKIDVEKLIDAVILIGLGLALLYSCFYAIRDGISFLLYTQVSFFELLQGVGVITIGILSLFLATLSFRAIKWLSFVPSVNQSTRIIKELLEDHELSIGKINSIKRGKHKVIYYSFMYKGEMKNCAFKTKSSVHLTEEDSVYVLHNNAHCILL